MRTHLDTLADNAPKSYRRVRRTLRREDRLPVNLADVRAAQAIALERQHGQKRRGSA